MSHNHFYTNAVGVVVRGGACGVLDSNDFQDNSYCGMRISGGGSHPLVKKCFFRVQKVGVEVITEGRGLYQENTFEQITATAFQVSDPNTSATVIGCRFNACCVGLGVTNKAPATCNESVFNEKKRSCGYASESMACEVLVTESLATPRAS